MNNSSKNQPIDTLFMPLLPRGFFWDIQRKPSGTAGKDELTITLRVNSGLEDNVIVSVQMPIKPGPLSTATQAVLQEIGYDLKEADEARMMFRLLRRIFDDPK